MDTIINIFGIVLTAIVGVGVKKAFDCLELANKHNALMKEIQCSLMRRAIMQDYRIYSEKGYIDECALMVVNEIYKEYSEGCHENGYISGIMEDIKRLPRVEKLPANRGNV
jgi:hypothetical protein